jgi:hypothetical protein
MDTAKDNDLGIGFSGFTAKLQRVASQIGQILNFGWLVVMG